VQLQQTGFRAMASRCEIKLWSANANAEAIVQAAVAEISRIEAKYSRYQAGSVISQINANAGIAETVVDEETAAMLDFAQQCYALSGGLFDITSGVLRRAWDFKSAKLPTQAEIDALLPLIGWQKLSWQRPSIRLSQPGMQLDFGGFGKEYAADRAASVLIAAGQMHALVNLGGDVRVTGPQADGTPWRVGIQHPRQAHQALASIAISDGALATSGDYERYMEIDGKRYAHLLDPHTGYPIVTAQSASVQAPLCVFAGALASCALLKGEAGLDFLRAQELGFLWVDRLGQVVSG
jgi:FAD:protein FMN transferase